jgi:hypothetical protein
MQAPCAPQVPATTGTFEPPRLIRHQYTKPARSSLLLTLCATQEVWPWQQIEAGGNVDPWQVPCMNPELGGSCGGGVTCGQEPVHGVQSRPRDGCPPAAKQV